MSQTVVEEVSFLHECWLSEKLISESCNTRVKIKKGPMKLWNTMLNLDRFFPLLTLIKWEAAKRLQTNRLNNPNQQWCWPVACSTGDQPKQLDTYTKYIEQAQPHMHKQWSQQDLRQVFDNRGWYQIKFW